MRRTGPSRRRPIPALLAVAALLVATLPGTPLEAASQQGQAATVAAKAGAGASIRAVARPARVREGQVVTIEVRAEGLRDAAAVAFHLVYDGSMIEPLPQGFSEGPLLRRGGGATSFLASPASTGDRVIVGLARLGSTEGAEGSGLLCRLTFRALRSGTTWLAFDRTRITSPELAARQVAPLSGSLVILPSRPGRKG